MHDTARPPAESPAVAAFCISTYEECLALFNGERKLTNDRAWPVTARAWLDLHQANLAAHQTPDENLAWWLGSMRSDGKENVLAVVPPSLPCFAGHFPGQPLLPGVLQLDWCIKLAALLWPNEKSADAFAGTARLKFKAQIKPADVIAIELTPTEESVSIKLSSRHEVLTSGRLLYRV